MERKKQEKIEQYLKTKYKDDNDFKIVDNNIYSKTCMSMQTLLGIHDINPIQVVYYLSIKSFPFSKGYKLGILLND